MKESWKPGTLLLERICEKLTEQLKLALTYERKITKMEKTTCYYKN